MVTSRWALAALVVCLAAAVWAQATGKAVRHRKITEADPMFPPELTQAEDAIEKKDYATAQPLLEKVVAANPANYQAWFDLGFVHNAQGKTEESIAAYRKSVAAKPDVFESNLNLGLMLAKSGNADAEQFLRAATKLKPTARVDEGHARAWLSLAHVIEATKPDDAIAAYREAAKLQPRDPEPHLSAGALLEKQAHPDQAELEYKQALELDSQSSDAFTGLINLYMRSKKYPEAERLLRKLAVLRPDEPTIRLQLGRVLAAEGKPGDAITELEAAAKVAPNDAGLKRDLADLYSEAGKFDLAEAEYKPLLSLTPNDPELHFGMGRALLMQKKFAEAEQEFITAVKLKPDNGDAYWQLAVAASENTHYELAIRAVDARAKLQPETPLSYWMRATCYDHLRDAKHAAENYHHFLEVAGGKYPDQEWQARHRLIAIEPKK